MKELPQYVKIAQFLCTPIDSGTLKPGDKLPSIRQIAREHKVSTMTALQAIRLLETKGKITAYPRSGYFVAEILLTENKEKIDFLPLTTDEDLHLSLVGTPCRIRLDLANASTELYPTDKLSIIMRQLIYKTPALLGAPVNGMGYEPLRHQIARKALDYGCALDIDEIIVTNGCIEALSLAIRATTKPGDTVVVESPTYFVILQMLQKLGRTVIEIPTTESGLDLEQLEKAINMLNIRAIITIPNANNPMGSTPDEHAKKRLVTLAENNDIIIIEDDIYGDLCYANNRPKPLRAISSNVILCSGFSKTLSPGFRIGWVAAGRHTSTLSAIKYTTTMGTAIYPQATIAEFLRSGSYDIHIKKLRKALSVQIKHIRDTITQYFPPGTTVTDPKGGFVLWVTLPEHTINTRELLKRARLEGIGIAPGAIFASDNRFDHAFRLNAGFGWNTEVKNAIITLAELVCN
ncbi:PLP-dependent aminotransferase family protein [Prodigiosinella confusarubida]|uniref:PLP-dependent aminotransferase family protein n=1 Tax=Serratia sp. (strain ATCC 39006) TaxID=104623 RepID=A0A2I5T6Q5_SERS3|nr:MULTISPECIES: PLP-dependent aminotransferase family protein [Enterobacterales]AUH00271.1 PLP-dependent aminotransferase family protein [Serratia sp. ATCC 39006]AUH04591.1 PLP-dependent aminotransferase family protein [Serratia sp. ATCC 39006]WJV52464.1 PLP-dependent aminotransferase family protein [Prodigiosinella sp. LS101]WJV56818.1 PLP-dependent aminotransferase family protein [Pectobacteriaceae bacterium C111]